MIDLPLKPHSPVCLVIGINDPGCLLMRPNQVQFRFVLQEPARQCCSCSSISFSMTKTYIASPTSGKSPHGSEGNHSSSCRTFFPWTVLSYCNETFWKALLQDDHLVHRGHGVFDTALVVDGRIYMLDRHLERLIHSAAQARSLAWTGSSVPTRQYQLLDIDSKWLRWDCRVYLVLTLIGF